jgi:polyribonucleotide nucleotidyltransferase
VASNELHEAVSKFCTGEIWGILRNISHKKMSRDNELFGLLDSAKEHVASVETISDKPFLVDQAFWKCVKEVMNKMILDENIRVDGRGVNDLRPIECEVDLFKPLHGSARFRRGETEVISSVTFDSLESSIKADTISQIIGAQKSRNFMLHYEFPPFANNVTGRFMSASRREVGHGVLAERGIQPLVPSEFPFTIRVSSQVTDSNGSSSMATVCSGSLALFDAGVPMVRPAAGVACGLMLEQEYQSESERQYKVISDLSGIEDACGHMDFKIAGTSDGVTSCQLDIKDCHGLSCDMIRDAIMSSKESRHKVLDIMNQCQDKPRPSLKPNTPVFETMEVPVLKRHRIVGAGGHKIRKLIEETGAELATIDENIMSIFAPSQAIMDEVLKRIDVLLNEPEDEPDRLEMGAVYSARVVDIKSFGVMVELAPSGVKALLHLSQIDHKKVAHPDELGFQLGQTMSVKYFGRDPAGRLRISRKVLLKNPFRENSHTPATSQSVMEFIDETISKNKKKKKK